MSVPGIQHQRLGVIRLMQMVVSNLWQTTKADMSDLIHPYDVDLNVDEIASLSTTPGAIHGLREYQLVDCLQRPGRDLSTFKANVLDKLATRAWYRVTRRTAQGNVRRTRTRLWCDRYSSAAEI